jgi:hypothetical protein
MMSKMIGNLIPLNNVNSLKSSIFTKHDMENAFEKLRGEIETTVRSELEMFYRMSGMTFYS